MVLFPSTAYALGTGGGGDPTSAFMGMMPLILMFGIFYFLLIRPQQKRAKEHKVMLADLKRGDDVVTSGGVHGKITGVTDDILTLEIAPNVKIRVAKGAVANKRGS